MWQTTLKSVMGVSKISFMTLVWFLETSFVVQIDSLTTV